MNYFLTCVIKYLSSFMRVVDLFNSYFDAGAKELLQSISVKQGKKMDSPESAKDIKKFINSFKAWYSFCPKIMPALNVFYVWIRCVAHHLTSKYYVVSMEKSMHEWWLVLFWVFGTYGNLLVSLSCTFHTNSKQVLNFLFSFICHFFFSVLQTVSISLQIHSITCWQQIDQHLLEIFFSLFFL